MPADPKPRLTDGRDAEIAEYHALSGLAVAGLIVGLWAPVAMIAPLLWTVPLAGIALCGWALRRIGQSSPALVGRKAALLGLTLSLLFGVAAPTDWLGYRWVLRREARRFAQQWFDFALHQQWPKAFQLTQHPKSRQPLDDQTLRFYYRRGSKPREELENYAAQPLNRALGALGERAQVRYYQTDGQGLGGEKDIVIQTYAVTYHDQQADEKKTFFVGLQMERLRLDTGQAEWQLSSTADGSKPEGL